jgi:hypothetical protein
MRNLQSEGNHVRNAHHNEPPYNAPRLVDRQPRNVLRTGMQRSESGEAGVKLSIPIAFMLSLGTAAGGAYLGVAQAQSAFTVRIDHAERRIEAISRELPGYVPGAQFSLAVEDLKRELDEIRSDVKEIRRGVGK